MRFHEFGDKNNLIIILIHGTLTPWQMWEKQIEIFSERYFVIVPALVMGHKDIKITLDYYAHASSASAKEEMERVMAI